jgi:hypothetical protein
MRLIKGRRVKREEPRDEERFRFPANQEPWEVSCASDEDLEEQAPAAEGKADLVVVARVFGGSAVA